MQLPPRLPHALLLLLLDSLTFALAQTTSIPLNTILSGTLTQVVSPLQFSIPAQSPSDEEWFLAVNLCTNQNPLPRFIVSNFSSGAFPSLGDVGQSGVFEVVLDGRAGVGSLEVGLGSGGTVQVFVGNVASGKCLIMGFLANR